MSQSQGATETPGSKSREQWCKTGMTHVPQCSRGCTNCFWAQLRPRLLPAPSPWRITDRQVLGSLLGNMQQKGCLKRYTQVTAPDNPFLSKSLPVVTHTTVPSQMSPSLPRTLTQGQRMPCPAKAYRRYLSYLPFRECFWDQRNKMPSYRFTEGNSKQLFRTVTTNSCWLYFTYISAPAVGAEPWKLNMWEENKKIRFCLEKCS